MRVVTASIAVLASLGQPAGAQPVAPGGFLEAATTAQARPRVTPPLPARGKFTFPAPYNTQGVRLTNAGDCGGNDCVDYIGYSYWRNTNNHVGSDTMLVFVTLDLARGGTGPTLFSYNKLTDEVTVVGPLFDPNTSFAWATGEGWYFSATMPTKLYVNEGPRLYRYDVLTKQLETVFDVTSRFGSDKIIWQIHSSNDDRVHSATLRDTASYSMLGCLAYNEGTRQFFYAAAVGDFDECQVDKSGRWLLIKENVDGAYGEDNRIIDLTTSTETRFLDQQGAAGHSDNGFGYMVAEDNWADLPGAVRVWTFGQPLPGTGSQGRLVYHTTDWAVDVGHVSHANARPGVPLEQQIACASHVSRQNLPRANELTCFRLDSSLQVLVVAPMMTSLDAAGGGDDYGKLPKGNLDVTGQYFIWTSNAGGSRLDAFIVKVPSHLLVAGAAGGSGGTAADTTAPAISIAQPASGAGVSGTVTVNATASDKVGVAGVQFKLNGANLGSEVTAAPFSLAWNTATSSNGSYTLTAVARDAAGNSATSAGVPVTVNNAATGGSGSGGGSSDNGGSSNGGSTGGGGSSGSGGSGSPTSGAKSVVWAKVANASSPQGSLQKTGGCDGCPDSGAVSTTRIAGDGYMEFTASETGTLRYLGLSPTNPGLLPSQIRYAFGLQPGGIAEIREYGVYRAETRFAPGDVLRIAVKSKVVRYYKNGALVYASKGLTTGAVLVDASLLSSGATVKNVVVSGAK